MGSNGRQIGARWRSFGENRASGGRMENFIGPPSALRRVFGNSDRTTEKSTSAAQRVTSIGADGGGVPCIVGSFHCLPRNPRPFFGNLYLINWLYLMNRALKH
jgi:hypothetical protein